MDKLSVVKIGGNVIEDTKQLTDFLTALSQMQGAKILVHGGGHGHYFGNHVQRKLKFLNQTKGSCQC